jgi:large subunit ribosomal protein L5
MKEIMVSKVVLNIGAGEPGAKLDKAKRLLEKVSGAQCVTTRSKKRVPTWGLRPGVEIGVKCTIRGTQAVALLKRLFEGVDNKVKASNFDRHGNLNFGVAEYITVPDADYDPSIGIIGFDVAVGIERKGYRIKRKHIRKSKIGRDHMVKKDEAIEFIKKNFGVEVV